MLGSVRVATLNLKGDEQSDLTVHGGVHKAVYVYPSEHYKFWRKEIPGVDLSWGAFGENFTTEGLLEEAVHIGDRLRIVSAEFIVTQPRMPCYKLGIRFEMPDMVKRFLSSGHTGFYFAVAQEGVLREGDPIEVVTRQANNLTVADITRLYAFERDDRETLQQAVHLKALPESWRNYFAEQLDRIAP